MTFQVGDKVSALGFTGTVSEIFDTVIIATLSINGVSRECGFSPLTFQVYPWHVRTFVDVNSLTPEQRILTKI